MFVTSNYAEKLDPALIRPGRIDLNLRFTYADRDTIRESYAFFFEIPAEQEPTLVMKFADLPSDALTMAEVHSVFMTDYDNAERAFEQFCILAGQKFFEIQVEKQRLERLEAEQ